MKRAMRMLLGLEVLGVLVVSAALCPGPLPAAAADAAAPVTHGINLASVCDWSTEWPFADALKVSRPWISHHVNGTWDDGRKAKTTPDGGLLLEDGQQAGTMLFTGDDNPAPPGRYLLTFAGKGTVQLLDQEVTSGPGGTGPPGGGRAEFQVTAGTRAINLRVTASDPADPVRDLHLWMPGAEPGQLFHPLYLERLRGFAVLRFMDWQCTNNSPQVTWSQRTTPRSPRQLAVSVEHCVDLANALDADPWLCVPHLADDDYVAQMARVVRDRMEPGREAYVEYSNETWNGSFQQSGYCGRKGQELKLSANAFEAQNRYHAKRSVEVFKIFEREFGGLSRLVRVMASQSSNAWVSDTRLKFEDAYRSCDALAVAPYFGHNAKGATVDQVIGACRAHIDLLVKEAAGQKAVADRYGLRLIAYEAGQHLQAPKDAALTAVYIAANRDPRMYELYSRYIGVLGANGVGLVCWYNSCGTPSKWGSWGLLERLDQPLAAAHKFRAVLDTMPLKDPRINRAGNLLREATELLEAVAGDR